LLVALVPAACIARDRLVCTSSSQCSLHDGGMCIDGGCAYPDGDCPSGLRYSELAEHANACVEDDVAEGSSSGVATTGSTTSSDTGGSTSSDTGPMTPCDGVDCSGAGACVVIDDGPSCACDPGYFMVGLECLLDPCDSVTCFFVDDVAGDDANDGSREAPWRSIARLNQALPDASPGDHYLLRRGGLWADASVGYQLHFGSTVGTEDAPVVVGAYGPLADGAPLLSPGVVHIEEASHVVLRDLDIRDDAGNPDVCCGSRACVWIESSDHVTLLGNRLSNCDQRGVLASHGSEHTAIVGNVITGINSDGVAIIDYSWVKPPDPIPRVGPHHWVIDNQIDHPTGVGIAVDINTPEIMLGDAKIVRNRISDAAVEGISSSTTGYGWVVDNIVARSGDTESYHGALSLSAEGGLQVTGNIVFEAIGNGVFVNRHATLEANTVIHDGTLGDAIALRETALLEATRNVMWARGGNDTVHVMYDAASDHIVALDQQWYVGDDATPCSFRDTLAAYDLATWQMLGFDLASSCAPVGADFGNFATGFPIGAWDDDFLAAFVPPSDWAGCGQGIGAFDCDGTPTGLPIAPLDGFDDDGGVGWPGPLVVQQRYDIGQR
jgi:hypothetical protein